LPYIDEKILAYHRSASTLDWKDKAAVIDYMTRGWSLLSGSAHPFDDAAIRPIATGEVSRANNLLSMFNHALLKEASSGTGRLARLARPTLVIHGTEDPVLPYPHGEVLARTIPHARLLTLQGSGHEIHENDWTRSLPESWRNISA